MDTDDAIRREPARRSPDLTDRLSPRSLDEADARRRDRSRWPEWVRTGLWGLPTRASALAFLIHRGILVAASLAIGFFWPWAFLGCGFALSGLWYWQAIRWVDRHGEWE